MKPAGVPSFMLYMRPEHYYEQLSKELMISPRFTLRLQDLYKWAKNQRTFLAPLAIFYVVFVTGAVQQDGIAASDFVPSNAVIAAMALYLLNAAYDLLRKWVGEHKY